MDFNDNYTKLRDQARANRFTLNTTMNRIERDWKAGILTHTGASELRKAADDTYRQTREKLRAEYFEAVERERRSIGRTLAKPPASVTSSDWRAIAQQVEGVENDAYSRLIDQALTYGDQGLARGIGARVYREHLAGRTALEVLSPLVDLDPAGIAEALDFESAHGTLRPVEVKILGPFGGID